MKLAAKANPPSETGHHPQPGSSSRAASRRARAVRRGQPAVVSAGVVRSKLPRQLNANGAGQADGQCPERCGTNRKPTASPTRSWPPAPAPGTPGPGSHAPGSPGSFFFGGPGGPGHPGHASPAATVQRMCPACEDEVQRDAVDDEEEQVQTKSTGSSGGGGMTSGAGISASGGTSGGGAGGVAVDRVRDPRDEGFRGGIARRGYAVFYGVAFRG